MLAHAGKRAATVSVAPMTASIVFYVFRSPDNPRLHFMFMFMFMF